MCVQLQADGDDLTDEHIKCQSLMAMNIRSSSNISNAIK